MAIEVSFNEDAGQFGLRREGDADVETARGAEKGRENDLIWRLVVAGVVLFVV